jgi:hypothetical protein
VPAAAVIPAPIAYIKIVAVKKLVVGFLVQRARPAWVHQVRVDVRLPSSWDCVLPFTGRNLFRDFYFEKIRVFKAGFRYEYISME